VSSNSKLSSLITSGAESLGISLPNAAVGAFQAYYRLLEKIGSNVNLTAVAGEGDVAKLHFLDSIALLTVADFKGAHVLDIGSGAGFPGVPLKIAEPSISLTLLDASAKRISFLTELCETLDIEAQCIHARAEEFINEPANRESRDIVVSRAVARLNQLSELCLPFVKIGGIFIAMKSTDSDDEISGAASALNTLGAKLSHCIDYDIPATNIKHRAVIMQKIAETPPKYPRRFARIQKAPL